MRVESPYREVRGQVFLGLDEFIERMKPYVERLEELKAITRAQHLEGRSQLGELSVGGQDKSRQIRDRLIRQAHEQREYMLSEIAGATRLHYSGMSRIVNRK